MKNTNEKIKIELTKNELFTIVEMLNSCLENETFEFDTCIDDYETVTSKLIEIYNKNR